MYKWIIPGKLAQSPLPRPSDVEKIAGLFDAVVVLTMPSEHHPLYIDKLVEHGLKVLHIPTPDFHPVELLDLLNASVFIDEVLSMGGRVLVHCYGGIGRSGQVTTSYLLYTGLDLYRAISTVRSIIPSAVENKWQFQLLEDFETLLNHVDKPLLVKYIKTMREIQSLDPVAYRHASKVLQFTIELNSVINREDVDLKNELLKALLHIHRVETRNIVLNYIEIQEPSYKELLVELAHVLDSRFDSRVVVLYTRVIDEPEVTLLCRDNCEDISIEFKNKLVELTSIKSTVSVDWGLYLDYI